MKYSKQIIQYFLVSSLHRLRTMENIRASTIQPNIKYPTNLVGPTSSGSCCKYKTIHFDDVKIVAESKYFVGKLSNMDPTEILSYKGSVWGFQCGIIRTDRSARYY